MNWKVVEDLQLGLEQDTGRKMLIVGSCSLHTVRGVFRDNVAASGCNIEAFLSSAYYLCKDTSVRREDFTNLSSSSTFPLKFVAYRWIENVPVITRLLKILPRLKQCVKTVDEKKLKNQELYIVI